MLVRGGVEDELGAETREDLAESRLVGDVAHERRDEGAGTGGDQGLPVVLAAPESASAQAFTALAARLRALAPAP